MSDPTGERFRGSSEIPLTAQGISDAHDVGVGLASRGGLDEIHTSNLGRAIHTARIISHYTHAPIVDQTDGFHPWHVGRLEGQPITPQSIDLLQSLVRDYPDSKVTGRGPLSTADGESFNSFKTRTLGALQSIIQRSAIYSDKKIAVVTHYRVKKLLDAWMRGGMDPDGGIDTDEMLSKADGIKTAGVDRLSVDPYAGPEMSAVDLKNPSPLMGGVYLIRHGSTDWNSPQ